MFASIARALCLILLACCTPLAHAQIYHCVGAHGEPVYSGEPCGTPAPSGTSATGAANRLGGVCADSPQALQQAIAGAFTAHDVNRLAGLILWRGMDQASARATLQSLGEWLKQPLVGIAVAYPTGPPAIGMASTSLASAPVTAGPGAVGNAAPIGFAISTSGDTRNFGVTESGGCWWLTF